VKRRQARSLVLKCPTWDHVEAFYARKVKEGGALSARVPFHPAVGEVITLAIELPDELIVALDAEVEEATPAGDGKKSAVRLRMIGLTRAVRRRLETLVAEARREQGQGTASASAARPRSPSSAPPPISAQSERDAGDAIPPPLPTDAPVDELVEPPVSPAVHQVPADARPVFEALDAELRRMRDTAAHDILQVSRDADVAEIREAYFSLTRRLHPDGFAHHRSAPLQQMANEVFIHINRAYERMRDRAIASGSAIAAGPDLLPHRGWMADMDDIGDGSAAAERPAHGAPPVEAPARVPAPTPPPRHVAPPPRHVAPPPTPPSRRATPPPIPRSAPPSPLTSDGLFGDMGASPSGDASGDADGGAGERSPTPSPARPTTGAHELPRRPGSESGSRSWRASGGIAQPRPAAEVMTEARDLIAGGEWTRAKEILADSLRREPRNRGARALYHLASAEALLAEGKPVDARTQLEVALAHDPGLAEAKAAMERTRSESARKAGLLRRLFK
jgi:hypothetical protein